jgi:hypothetical protein
MQPGMILASQRISNGGFHGRGYWKRPLAYSRRLMPKLSLGEGPTGFPLDKKLNTRLLYACSEQAYDRN